MTFQLFIRVLRLFYHPYELRQKFFLLIRTLEVLYFKCHGFQELFEPYNVCSDKAYALYTLDKAVESILPTI